LLLSRAQTPDRSLGEFGRLGVAVDLVQQGCVELPLCVDRCRGLPDLSPDSTFLLLSFSRERSAWRRDPTPLIQRWRKSQNGRLIFLTLISGGLWLRWHWGVAFSFVSVVSVGFVTTERGLEVVLFFVFFEDGNEVVEVEVLMSVVVEVIENTVSDDMVERTGLSNWKGLTVLD
jgi:hypothetical protein